MPRSDPPASPPNVLVVEDDRALAVGLDLNLTAEGFEVRVAGDGEVALRMVSEREPDLIVLDLQIPIIDGMTVLAELRHLGKRMPVIILSARGEEEDKVAGLEVGADDYVAKPFSLRELVARIRAALRRAGVAREQEREQHEEIGELAIELGSRRVFRAQEEVHFTSREFDLLAFFLRSRGRAHTREALLSAVWGYDYEGTARTVDNFVRRLRSKLEPDPTQPEHLITVHGVGYRLE